ncbi:PREDICTED: ephrin type-B receptor 3-like [Priapulus caudatus]|uniref:Ephrin type-B receptor 3-like n=1 Tax=Priapulus caudatus TaxID=37621 RepID=A0ABM1E7Q2_PRICU|nr:PREDICTED: ephrin type-B receptor 3-like [Priapulus caudatus]
MDTLLSSVGTASNWTSHDADSDGTTWQINPTSFSSDSQGASTAQENWLISPYIPLQGATAIGIRGYVNFKFCDYADPELSIANCRVSLQVSVLSVTTPMDNVINALSAFNVVAEVVPTKYEELALADIEDVEVPNWTSSTSGVYLAFVDKGTRVTITEMNVFYKYCGRTLTNLAVFNDSMPSSSPHTGTCVEDATSQIPLTRICHVDGKWEDFTGECTCDTDFTSTSMTCDAPKCTDTTCKNGGVCTDTESGAFCDCDEKFLGKRCQFSKTMPPGKPVITGYDAASCVNIGEKISLTCTSEGGFQPISLLWFCNAAGINSTLVSQKRNTTTLLYRAEQRLDGIEATVGQHGARYECRASNAASHEPVVSDTTLLVCAGPTTSSISVILKPVDAATGYVNVICDAESTYPFTALTFEWSYNGESVLGLIEYHAAGRISSITVNASKLADGGIFTCSVNNTANGMQESENVRYRESIQQASAASKTGMIIGGVLAILAIGIGLYICYMKRKSKKTKHADVKYQHSIPRQEL